MLTFLMYVNLIVRKKIPPQTTVKFHTNEIPYKINTILNRSN